MKKLLIIEIIAAVLFLGFLVAAVGMLTWGIRSMNTSNSAVETKSVKGDGLKMQMGDLQEDFSPLQYQGETEENMLSLCFENLLSRDEKGRVTGLGENLWEQEGSALAHISSRKAQDNSLYITIKLNSDRKTSEGKNITARDVIFNYYLRLDASSGLSDCFAGAEIAGAKAYTYGSGDIAGRQKEIEQLLLAPSQVLKNEIMQEIIKPELQREFLWVQSLYQDNKYQFITSKYTKPKDLFAYYYAYQTTYQSENRTETQVMEDITAQYGANYIALGKVTEKDYSEQAKRMALREILKQSGKDTVKSVSGIRLVDEYTVEIQVLSGENVIEKVCDFWILPLSIYGEVEKYDGNVCFGYQKGEADRIVSLSQQKFLGTGAFYMLQKQPEKFILKKNPFYQEKVGLNQVEIIRKEYERQEELVNAMLKGRLDMAVVRWDQSLERLLNNRGTGAAHQIKKIKLESDNMEECILYRTDYVNATTLPKKKQTIRGVFNEFYTIKINSVVIGKRECLGILFW